MCVLGSERAGQAGVLDEPTPPLVPTMDTGNRFATGQGSVLGAVGQRPLPRLAPQLFACVSTAEAVL